MQQSLFFGISLAVVSLTLLSPNASAVELARGTAPQQPQQPHVAVDCQGAIHVAYGIGDLIQYRRSNDDGRTFSPPVTLPPVHVMSLGRRRGPRIAVAGNSICITAIGGKQGKGRDGDVLALRSSDGGRSWEGPVAVNDSMSSAREGLHAMAAGDDGTMCCAWLDLRNRRTEIVCSTSTNGGATWRPNTLVYQSPDGSVCECCHPAVAFDSAGRIFVQWRNSLGGARDMYVASSSDGGITFGPATKLGSGSWPLKACPMDGGYIATIAPGKVATTWRREQKVYLTVDGSSEEKLLGDGEQPWIAATSDGPAVVWLKKRGEAVMLLKPGSSQPLELTAHANDPVISAGPLGRGPLAVVWEFRDGASSTIQCQVVSTDK